MPSFHQTLVELRRTAGFSTAYAFYHRNGGRGEFPFTFSHYLKLEKGTCLPRPAWLLPLVQHLRIPPADESLHRLIDGFLRGHFGSDDAYRRVAEPLLAPVPVPAFGRHTAKKLLSAQAYHLTPVQYEFVLASEARFWAFECLSNDRTVWSPAALAERTGLPRLRMATALRELAGAGLAKRVDGERYKSPLAGRFYVYPSGRPGQADPGRWRDHVEAMVRRRGETVGDETVVLRAGPAAFRRISALLLEVLETAASDAILEPTASSALFILQFSVRRALPL